MTIGLMEEPSTFAISGGAFGDFSNVVVQTCQSPNTTGLGKLGGGSSYGGSQQLSSVQKPRFDEETELSLIKVVVLGAPGVGKTSLIKRFVSNEFDSNQATTATKSEYFPSLFLNDNLYELKIIDLPSIPFFPPNNDVEWTDYRFYGLRSASAYIMVYDAGNPSTFQLIKSLRDQMYESRDMTNIPVVVAANKMDVVTSSSIGRLANHAPSYAPLQTQVPGFSAHRKGHHKNARQPSATEFGNHQAVTSSNYHRHQSLDAVNLPDNHIGQGQGTGSTTGDNTGGPHHGSFSRVNSCTFANSGDAKDIPRTRKDIMNMVKKSWKSNYVECSALYNWNVVNVFRELGMTLDMIANGQVIGSTVQTSNKKKGCLMF